MMMETKSHCVKVVNQRNIPATRPGAAGTLCGAPMRVGGSMEKRWLDRLATKMRCEDWIYDLFICVELYPIKYQNQHNLKKYGGVRSHGVRPDHQF